MATLIIDPIIFTIGGFLTIRWYGVILGMGALIGLWIAIREGKRFGIPQEFFMDVLLFGVPSAIVGARLYFVAFKWEDYKDNLLDIFKTWEGGIAIYGALIGAIICAVILFKKRGYDFWRIADILAPGLIIGQMIGRWGNFVNQEAYGGPTTETFLSDYLHLPSFIVDQMNIQGVYHHPTFLYESVWSLFVLIALFILRRQKFVRAGEVFFSYFILYSIGRFFIEAVRTDSLAFQGPAWLASFINTLWAPMEWLGFEHGALDAAYGNIRISQLLPIIIVVVAVAWIIYRRMTIKNLAYYSDPIVSTKSSGADELPHSNTASGKDQHAVEAKNGKVENSQKIDDDDKS